MHESRHGCDTASKDAGLKFAPAEYWRSAEDLEKTPEFRDVMAREFGPNAQELASGDDRRTFIKLMGAGIALAGLAACRRWPESKIVAFSQADTGANGGRTAGVPIHYATSVEVGGIAWPVLAKSFDGRPIKLEGNPALPFAAGSNSIIQARVLELYDPDRSRSLTKSGQASTWTAFSAWCGEAATKFKANGGAGLAVLVDTSMSPSLEDMKTRFMAAYPKAWWGNWSAMANDNVVAAAKATSGAIAMPNLEKAKVIVALDADLLGCPVSGVAHSAAWAKGRRVNAADPAKQELSRMYVAEPSLTVTGMSADDRLAVRRSDIPVLAAVIAKELGVSNVDTLATNARAGAMLDAHGKEILAQLVADLKAAGSAAVVVAGPMQDPATIALAAAINEKLGAVGTTVSYFDGPASGEVAQLAQLAGALESGAIETLVLLGGNPLYDAPADLAFAAKLSKAKEVVHLSFYANETSKSPACTWHVPAAHSLESWSDGRAIDGSIVVQQPLILPILDVEQGGRNALEVLAALTGDEETSSYEIVRRAHMKVSGLSGAAFESWWRENLNRGYVESTAWKAAAAPKVDGNALGAMCTAAAASAGTEMELAFAFDAKVGDGRFANLGWLQEVPDVATKVTWDNALLMSPATARSLGFKQGDMAKVTVGSASMEAAVWALPGHADNCATIALGYGRGEAGGRIANGAGFNAYPLRTTTALGGSKASISKTGATYAFAHTQDHGAADALIANVPTDGIQARLPSLVRESSLANYKAHPDFARHVGHVAHRLSLWEESNLDGAKYRWAMTIDLSTCTGCSACVVACQAENNVPIVGKAMVARGREMHWIRIDRYFRGKSVDNPSGFAVQPLACMHCENAPCEQVCPVAATVHDEQGINVMVYNRCIGTRYCSNNCPYKVRRFNFFDYQKRTPDREEGFLKVGLDYYKDIPNSDYPIDEKPDAWSRMQHNPDVTVRSRGVMEKCSFCMQRIQEAKIRAKNAWAKAGGVDSGRETWSVEDGAVITACQQACPTQAIVFGDLNDPKSRVSQMVKSQLSYELLEELNTKPRVKYLARVKNPGVDHSHDDHGHDHSHDHDHDHSHDHDHGHAH
jgi:molybdopterin-containing oxidoreductase family iron-sulfur binding subunit